MRRIVAVFASRRSDKSDSASTAPSTRTENTTQTTKSNKARFFRSISRKSKPLDPVVGRINSTDLHPPSSSSSSSGAPTTPDDDLRSLHRGPKAWISTPALDSRLGSFHHLNSSQDARFATAARPFASSPSTFHTDTDDDLSEESSLAPDPSRPPERSPPLTPPAYLLAVTENALGPPFAPPPLLDVPGLPAYPRSSNPLRALPRVESLESTLHRTRLRRRLHRDLTPAETHEIGPSASRRSVPSPRPSLQLDDTAVRTGHPSFHSAGLRRWADRPCFEDRFRVLVAEDVPAPSTNAEPLWTRVVPATSCGIAALEYSITLELLSGFYEEDLPKDQQPVPATPRIAMPSLDSLRLDTQPSLGLTLFQSPVALSPVVAPASAPAAISSHPPSAPASPTQTIKAAAPSGLSASQSRPVSYKASPSPLRMEAVSASPPVTSAVPSPSSLSLATSVSQSSTVSPSFASPPVSAASAPPALKSAMKQGVRFAEEEKEDQIPLGYVMRIKQKREEKARFLQAERERRKHEEERVQHEEEKRRWEAERSKWEREKRAMEEERKKRLYADEVSAARNRRESQRMGFNGNMTGEGLATGQWDRERRPSVPEVMTGGSYSRAAYDSSQPHPPLSYRQQSESSLSIPKQIRQGSTSGSGSPGDSRPNSVYGSRPPSMHSNAPTPSSSQQDFRERRQSGSQSRRSSMISEGGSRRYSQAVPMPLPPTMWGMGPMPMNMGMGTMPMMPMQPIGMQPMGMQPMYGMEPLLPPSPPFMHGHGARSPSQNSSRGSPTRSQSSSPTMMRQGLPSSANSSSERVNCLSTGPHSRGSSGSPASARAPSIPRSESSPRRHGPGHQRTSSGEILPHRPTGHPRVSSHGSGEDRDRDRRHSRAAVQARPSPTHSQSMPLQPSSSSLSGRPPLSQHSASQPPSSFGVNHARSSWSTPRPGFENVSRPGPGKRQTVLS
ncbi:uncharacterized protein BXZ73DRAFT_40483 [Epithele typhae]|uniref:uncharacterized protein n=1 Tax=Epithele typhae TaxID=378194 RepID=UPI0020088710|nr:uncharacterized protein BXZ73DRAFT_40483 [Epithele typhae]KAH9943463.1 hypothetical protein BXZ73DRAFT_40483 [Epithele typhae]